MNVLHFHSGNMFGGVETALLTLARHQGDAPDCAHHFALCFRGRLAEELETCAAPVHDVGAVRLSRPWTVWRVRRRARRLIDTLRPDVVVCHAPWALAVFTLPAQQRGVPVAGWIHGFPNPNAREERRARRLPPSTFIANSQRTAAAVRAAFPGTPVHLLYYPVDPPTTVGHHIAREPNTVVIVQVSRLEAWKGHALLFEALAKLPGALPWEAWIVGGAQTPAEQRYLAQLHTLADRLGITDRVRFMGPRSDVGDVLAAADVFCQPNTEPEPFGIVFVEALYAGLPVVTTAVAGGATEILDDDCGVVVPQATGAMLADALAGLLRDEARRRRAATHGPERAAKWCQPTRQVARLAQLLAGLRTGSLTEQRLPPAP